MNVWTDIGVNLTGKRFDQDRAKVIEQAFAAGVRRMVVTGTDLAHSKMAVELCEQYPLRLRCTVGCHPHNAKDMTEEAWAELEELMESPFVVAVGECGLDFNRMFSPAQTQIEVFARQIELACKLEKPLFLHQRDAHNEMASILKQYRGSFDKAVVHCFTGDESELKDYLELDLYIGITGWITDKKRNHDLLEAVPLIPNDRLLLETDAPYLLPKSIPSAPKSGRNEPQFLPYVGEALAEVRHTSTDIIASICSLNSATFFNWPIDVSVVLDSE